MSRVPLIAGNWKMYKTGPEAIETAQKLMQLSSDVKNTDIMIAPPFLWVPQVSKTLQLSQIKVGVQNIHFGSEGAFTGEISADMVKSSGAEYVIIGHSERRQYFGETDDAVCKKIRAAFGAGLIPILCIGETQAQREAGKTFLVLDKQVSDGLKGFGPDELDGLVLAYEPVWAIGTGNTASIEQVHEVHQYLRSLVGKLFTKTLAQTVRILYGGSVNPENVTDIMSIEDVDGALVGGASLDAETFIKIIKFNP